MAFLSSTNDQSLDLTAEAAVAASALELLDSIDAGSAEPAFLADASVQSLAFSLDPAELAVTDADGILHHASFDATDATVQALAGSLPGLTLDPSQASLPWSAQVAVVGSRGNDTIALNGSEQAPVLFASAGSDRLVGSSALLNVADYSQLVQHDQLSGLFLTNDPGQITLVEHNLPPLLAEAFSSDDLLVFKGTPGTASVDQLESIEVVRSGDGDDQLLVTDQRVSPLVIDLGDGLDIATLVSEQPPTVQVMTADSVQITWSADPSSSPIGDLTITNLETLQWQTPSSLSTFQAVSLATAFEDQAFRISLGEVFPEAHLIQSINVELVDADQDPTWLQASVAELDSQISDRVVLESSLFTADLQAINLGQLSLLAPGTEFTVDLAVSDNRSAGAGLLGLQGALSWNPDAAELLSVEFSEQLPLMNQSNEASWASGEATLAAAALPAAGAGEALGDHERELFARLTFELTAPGESFDYSFLPSLYPALGEQQISEEQLFLIDLDRPLITIVEGLADQAVVGDHQLLLEATYSTGGQWQQRLNLVIENTNDAPSLAGSPSELLVNEDSEISASIAELFVDVDLAYGDQLSYRLLNAPAWITLDPSTGVLEGVPGNDDVGHLNLLIEASDLAGSTVQQIQPLFILNVNDAPEPGLLDLPLQTVVRQGDHFSYVLPSGAFVDPDVGDQLRFELAEASPVWLEIDAETGVITGMPDPAAPGRHTIEIVAIDLAGAEARRTLVIDVENINDAPVVDSGVVDLFRSHVGDPWVVREDDPVTMDPFQYGAWFVDPDSNLGDTLAYTASLVFLGDVGEQVVENPAWLSINPSTGLMELQPANDQVGDYRLTITAIDQAGLTASVMLSMRVENTNDPPSVNEAQASLFNTITIEEDAAFSLLIPRDLFNDVDRGDALTLSVQQSDGSVLPSWIQFDPLLRQLSGVSHTSQSSLDLQITATDRFGATASHQLQLLLPRQATLPELTLSSVSVEEGQSLLLAEAVQVTNADPDSEVLRYRLTLTDLPPGVVLQQQAPDADPLPEPVNGVVELMSLDGVALVDAGGDFAGSLSLPLEVISEEINGDQRITSVNLALQWIAIADRPILALANVDHAQLDPFQPIPLADYALASVTDVDGSELIDHYALTLIQTEATSDLRAVDADGKAIGRWEIQPDPTNSSQLLTTLSLTPEEWAIAHFVSAELPVGTQLACDLTVVAREASNGDMQQSNSESLTLLVSPFVEMPDLSVTQSSGLMGVNDGSPSYDDGGYFEFNLARSSLKDHLALQIEVPAGTAIQSVVESTEVIAITDQLFLVTDDGLGGVALDLLPPENFSGVLEVGVSAFASARVINPAMADTFESDIENGFASLGESVSLALPVVSLAREPQLTELAFDSDTGMLAIGLQRGRNFMGVANGDESISLSISGIPSGYRLVYPADSSGTERPAGATDAFGSVVLFDIPSLPDGSLDSASSEYRFELLLRRTDPDLTGLVEQAMLSITTSAKLPPSGFLPNGDQSDEIVDGLEIIDWSGELLQSLVDPVIVDLDRDGLAFTELEASNVEFDLLNNGSFLRTGWLSPSENLSQRDDAFLVVDLDGNEQINSISELISEFFGSTGSRRRFASGLLALQSLDSNADGTLNAEDASWSDLKLWFDVDGDGRSQASELEPVDFWISSLDLSMQSVVADAVSNEANPLLRQGQLELNSGSSADFYDVGLRFDPSALPQDQPPLALEVMLATNLKEAGDPVDLHLSVPGFEGISSEEATRTLVRLSGLPDGVEPNVGVRDGRGDWVFTWSEVEALAAKGSGLQLISLTNQSGSATAQALISQIDTNGVLHASAFTSFRVDVTPVATAPHLLVRQLRHPEDEPILLSSVVVGGAAKLQDIDGSEELFYQISGLQAGVQLVQSGSPLALELDPMGNGETYRTVAPLSTLIDARLIPIEHYSGTINFNLSAVAVETANGDSQTVTRSVTVFVDAVPDSPLLQLSPSLLSTPLVLQEDDVLVLKGFSIEGSDLDGSEQLFVEISGLPRWASIRHDSDLDWRPYSTARNSTGELVVRVSASDLQSEKLQIVDVLHTDQKEDFSLVLTAISREQSNGLISLDSATLSGHPPVIDILFSNHAHTPIIQHLDLLQAAEDQQAFIALDSALSIQQSPHSRREDLQVSFNAVPDELTFHDKDGLLIAPVSVDALGRKNYVFSSVNGLQLQFNQDHYSGPVSFFIEAQSISRTGGQSATTGIQVLTLHVEPVADLPTLLLPEQLLISTNGLVDLSPIHIDSPDQDGSEQLILEIVGLPNHQQPLLIPADDLQNYQLSFPDQQEDITLSIRAISRDFSGGRTSEASSEPQSLLLLAGALAPTPLVEIEGTLIGREDVPAPLSSVEGGVINVTVPSQTNISLSYELSNIPEHVLLQKHVNGQWLSLPVVDGFIAIESLEGVAISLGPDGYGSVELQLDVVATSLRSGDSKRSSSIFVVDLLPVNDSPRGLPGSDVSLLEGDVFRFNLNERFFDPDADVLTFDLSSAADYDWVLLDPLEGEVTLRPDNRSVTLDGALHRLLFTAFDPLGLQDTLEIKVSVGNQNQAPVVNDLIPSFYVTNQDDAFSLVLDSLFDDADLIHGDQIRFEVENLPAWLAWDGQSTLSGTPGNSDVALYPITVVASDSELLSADRLVYVSVENRNDPPQLSYGFANGDSFFVVEDQPFSLDFSNLFFDLDSVHGGQFDVSVSSKGALPSWLQWNPLTSELTASPSAPPSNDDVGEYQLALTASDGLAVAKYKFNLVVQNVNDAPSVSTPLLPQVASEDAAYVLDISNLFVDEDAGDVLEYTYALFDASGRLIDSPEWLNFRHSDQSSGPLDEKIVVTPVFRHHDSGELIQADSFQALLPGDRLTVDVQVQDLRSSVTTPGLIGLGVQMAWSTNSLSLVDQNEASLLEAITSDLPFANSINLNRLPDGILTLNAASAPALGIGAEIGVEEADVFASLIFEIVDPSKPIFLELSPVIDELGQAVVIPLDQDFSDDAFHFDHFTTAQNLELVATPTNEHVGHYTIQITATDQSGEAVTSEFLFEVENFDDAPRLGELLPSSVYVSEDDQTVNLFGISESFLDEDSLFSESFRYEVIRDQSKIHGDLELEVVSEQGQPILRASIPGLIEPISEKVIIRAIELSSELTENPRTLEQSFVLHVRPSPALVPIESNAESMQPMIRKNMSFNLAETLSTFPLPDQLDLSDQTYLYLKSIGGLTFSTENSAHSSSWNVVESASDFTVYRALLSDLQATSGSEPSKILHSIIVSPPDNQGLLLEGKDMQLPLQLWTETFVKGDVIESSDYGANYGVQISDKLVTWVSLLNQQPELAGSRTITHAVDLQAYQEKPVEGLIIDSVSSLFVDYDPNESISYEVVIPAELNDLVLYDSATDSIRWADDGYLDQDDLGIYDIPIFAFDANYRMGVSSSYATAKLQLIIRGSHAIHFDRAAQQLSLLSESNTSSDDGLMSHVTQALLADRDQDLDPNLANICQLLRSSASVQESLMAVRAGSELSVLQQSIQTVAGSSLALLPTVLNDFAVVSASTDRHDISVENFSAYEFNLETLPSIYTLPSDQYISSIGPKLSFDLRSDLDASYQGFAVVNIELPSGLNAYTGLLKTRYEQGQEQAYDFKIIGDQVHTIDPADLDQLNQFILYGYGDDSPLSGIELAFDPFSDHPSIQSAIEAALSVDLDSIEAVLAALDGSAYLVDLTGDGAPNLLRVLLVDNGYFDLDSRMGFISDPLIPVVVGQLPTVPTLSTAPQFSTSAFNRSGSVPLIGGPSTRSSAFHPISPISATLSSARPSPLSQTADWDSHAPIVSDSGVFASDLPHRANATDRAGLESHAPLPSDSIRGFASVERFGAGLRSSSDALLDHFDGLTEPLISSLSSTSFGAFLLASLLSPVGFSFINSRLRRLDLQRLQLSAVHGLNETEIFIQIAHPRASHLTHVAFSHGRLSVCGRSQIGPAATTIDIHGYLEQILSTTSYPGLALRQLQSASHSLFSAGQADLSGYAWHEWLDDLLLSHRPNNPIVAAKSKLAKVKLSKDLQRLERVSPRLATMYMAAEVFSCLQALSSC